MSFPITNRRETASRVFERRHSDRLVIWHSYFFNSVRIFCHTLLPVLSNNILICLICFLKIKESEHRWGRVSTQFFYRRRSVCRRRGARKVRVLHSLLVKIWLTIVVRLFFSPSLSPLLSLSPSPSPLLSLRHLIKVASNEAGNEPTNQFSSFQLTLLPVAFSFCSHPEAFNEYQQWRRDGIHKEAVMTWFRSIELIGCQVHWRARSVQTDLASFF